METLVQEIANQLGIAVDQAGQFIAEYLPQYAALKSMQGMVRIGISWGVLLLVLALIAAIFLIYTLKAKSDNKKNETEIYDFSYYDGFWSWLLSLALVAVIILITAIVCTIYNIENVIGWSNYPEAMAIDIALHRLG